MVFWRESVCLLFIAAAAVAAPAQDRQEQDLYGHWALKELYRFAKDDLLKGPIPASHFIGGYAFTRRELAEIVRDAVAKFREFPETLTAPRRDVVKRLIEEFRLDLDRMGADTRLPEPVDPGPEPPPVGPDAEKGFYFRLFGSDITTFRAIEGRHNDSFTSLLDLNAEIDFARLALVGTLDDQGSDNRERHGGDFNLGKRYHFDLTERFLELFGHPFGEDLRVFGKAGNLRNVSFGQGLILGAATPDGLSLDLDWKENLHFRMVWGEDTSSTELLGGRLAFDAFDEQLTIGISMVDVNANDNSEGGLTLGADLRFSNNFLDAVVELADVHGGGKGYYAKTTFWYFPNLRFFATYRHYDEFGLRVNNAPIYQGTTGGDDVNDISYQGGVYWDPFDFMSLTARIEHAQRPDESGERRDAFLEARFDLWEGGRFTASTEYELDRDAEAINRLTIADFSQRFKDGPSISVNYTRDDRDRSVIDTLRGGVRYSMSEHVTVEYTHTLRLEGRSEEHIFQPRILWNISDSFFFSVRYTRSDDRDVDDTLDLTLVIRW